MAIIFPASCRNITAGALRQIKQQGYSTNTTDGGAFAKEYVIGLHVQGTSDYTRNNEPLGKFMTSLTQAQKDIEGTSEALSVASRHMIVEAEAASLKLADASRKMRDATEKLGAQMQKFHSIFASGNFAEQAKAALSLADAMERLAALEEKGLLANVMGALKNTRKELS